jgi:hypothetical protein
MKFFYSLLLIANVIGITATAQSLTPGQVTDNVYNKAILSQRFAIVPASTKSSTAQVLQTAYSNTIAAEQQDLNFTITYNAHLNTFTGSTEAATAKASSVVIKPTSRFAAHTNASQVTKFNFLQLMVSLGKKNAAITIGNLQLNGMNITGSYTSNTNGEIYWHLVYGEFGKDFTLTGTIHLDGDFSVKNIKNLVEFNFGTSSTLTASAISVYWGDIFADAKKNENVINWNTNKEINNDRFVVERATDGINFSGIGLIATAGNKNNGNVYNFTDNNFSEGTNYYRVKQIDVEGKASYSVVVRVSNNSTAMTQTTANNNSTGSFTGNNVYGRSFNAASLK